MKVNFKKIEILKAKYRYSVREIVDDFLRKKLDKEVRDFAKNELGIETVFKSFDLSKIDFFKNNFEEPQISLNDLYYRVSKKILSGSKPRNIGLLITINDNQQHLDPSPTVELVPRLSLKKNIRTQNFQGLACSSLSEAVLNSAGNFYLGNGESLVLIGTYYTPWFLDRIKQIKHISKKNKSNFYNLIYFLIFSDIVGGTILSPKKSQADIQVDSDHILTLKDTNKHGYDKATIKLSSDTKNRIIFDMNLNPKKLREVTANLSLENLRLLKQKIPRDYKKIKIWGFHTAGKRFVDHISQKCRIEKSQTKLTYELMKRTGNTGAVSSLQFMREVVNRKLISQNSLGCFFDYGWEGVNLLPFKKL